ncbi:UNVERIFIED_CONTAM: hypothetical protein Slati_1741400 [Sesamum latifolium]|uniref:Reverse transcriptase domain-containing protein n=1 Tax=Sesamum latifolium TaxID=2727402 RepID=A0AAW2WXC5_9LAMI
MSPALFLLCMELFSRLINSEFNFHPKCEKLKIAHLLFADNLMLFSRGDLPSVHILMNTSRSLGTFSALPSIPQNLASLRQCLLVTDYSPVVDRIVNYISKWTAKSLSFVGRLELISSVIQGIECFWLQCFPLPAAIVYEIHRLCRNFLLSSKKAPVAWEEICHAKEEGGLGIRHIQSWNVAVLA